MNKSRTQKNENKSTDSIELKSEYTKSDLVTETRSSTPADNVH